MSDSAVFDFRRENVATETRFGNSRISLALTRVTLVRPAGGFNLHTGCYVNASQSSPTSTRIRNSSMQVEVETGCSQPVLHA
jgi:hypothetical protein